MSIVVTKIQDTRWFYCLFMYTMIHIYKTLFTYRHTQETHLQQKQWPKLFKIGRKRLQTSNKTRTRPAALYSRKSVHCGFLLTLIWWVSWVTLSSGKYMKGHRTWIHINHKETSHVESASRDNWCTGTLWNRIMTAQCEGMGEVGSARYEPALLPPCPSIRVFTRGIYA